MLIFTIFFRPKVSTDVGDAAATTTIAKPLQTSESDDDDVEVDDGVDDDVDVQDGSKSNISGSHDLPSQSGKSPTHSMRSVLSRPRSAPQRRATISGSSPSHYKPYINVSEVRLPHFSIGNQ